MVLAQRKVGRVSKGKEAVLVEKKVHGAAHVVVQGGKQQQKGGKKEETQAGHER